ncbi:ARP2/3 complex subunit [Lotmaria passim]
MVRQLNSSSAPALTAAVEAYLNFSPKEKRHTPFTQTLHTFGGCTYTLTFITAIGSRNRAERQPSQRSVEVNESSRGSSTSSIHSDSNADAIHTTRLLERTESLDEPARVQDGDINARGSTTTLLLTFAHAIPFSQLDLFKNCVSALSAQLQRLAPHCVVSLATTSPALHDGLLQLTIPADVAIAERNAALAWVAEWRVVSLLPLLDGFLQQCQAAGERQTLTLLRLCGELDENTQNVSWMNRETGQCRQPRFESLAPVVDACLVQAIILCATPLPASTVNTEVSSSFSFDGTLTLTTCVTSRNAHESVLIRRYLDAFAEASNDSSMLLLVHESSQPPPELKLSATHEGARLLSLLLQDAPPYVWWCTMMLSPHSMRQAGVLQKALDLSLRLRHTVLFHVHQEHMSVHALLRQQLASYATLF